MSNGRSGQEKLLTLRPVSGRADDGCLYFCCSGPSMSPTLKPGDLIAVAPYGLRDARRGDIIVFSIPEEGRQIAHRIVAVRGKRFAVRGDNNNLRDPWSPEIKDILGRAVRRERNRAVRLLAGGRYGDLYGRTIRSLARLRRVLFRLFRPVYLWASDKELVRHLLPFKVKTRVVAVRRPEGIELLLVAGRIIIARKPAGSGVWSIKRPFRLVVDVRALPPDPEQDEEKMRS